MKQIIIPIQTHSGHMSQEGDRMFLCIVIVLYIICLFTTIIAYTKYKGKDDFRMPITISAGRVSFFFLTFLGVLFLLGKGLYHLIF